MEYILGMDSTDFLVYLLSFAMSIILLMTIVALFYAIKVLRSLRNISEKAEHIAGNVDAVSEVFKKTAGPVALGKLIANIVELARRKEKGEK
jgi:biopolymer transport protein ExbB/TolQ